MPKVTIFSSTSTHVVLIRESGLLLQAKANLSTCPMDPISFFFLGNWLFISYSLSSMKITSYSGLSLLPQQLNINISPNLSALKIPPPVFISATSQAHELSLSCSHSHSSVRSCLHSMSLLPHLSLTPLLLPSAFCPQHFSYTVLTKVINDILVTKQCFLSHLAWLLCNSQWTWLIPLLLRLFPWLTRHGVLLSFFSYLFLSFPVSFAGSLSSHLVTLYYSSNMFAGFNLLLCCWGLLCFCSWRVLVCTFPEMSFSFFKSWYL